MWILSQDFQTGWERVSLLNGAGCCGSCAGQSSTTCCKASWARYGTFNTGTGARFSTSTRDASLGWCNVEVLLVDPHNIRTQEKKAFANNKWYICFSVSGLDLAESDHMSPRCYRLKEAVTDETKGTEKSMGASASPRESSTTASSSPAGNVSPPSTGVLPLVSVVFFHISVCDSHHYDAWSYGVWLEHIFHWTYIINIIIYFINRLLYVI